MIIADDMGMTDGAYQFLYTQQKIQNEDDLQMLQSARVWRRWDGKDEQAFRGFHNLLLVHLTSVMNSLSAIIVFEYK